MANLRKTSITTAKVLISAALVYFIFTKIDFIEVFELLKKAKPWYLIVALLLICASKVLASLRLNLYFHSLNVNLTQKSNLKLYLLGMFYNLFLPGGIGGDAYKGYVIKKKFQVATKKVVSVLVLDRLSGLLLIGTYTCILALFVNHEMLKQFKLLFIVAIPVATIVFWGIAKKIFPFTLAVFWKSFSYSALVQLSQLVSILLILKSLNIDTQSTAYLFIFLISSIVSVIPLTIGGIGSRELTFYYGATLLGLNEGTSVGVSMLFFIMTALISLCGVVYHFKKIKLETQNE